MMNPFKSIPAGLAILSEINRFNKMAPQFEALRKEGKFEEERALILEGTGRFADTVSRKIGITFDIHGEENIPDHGPMLIVAKSVSLPNRSSPVSSRWRRRLTTLVRCF